MHDDQPFPPNVKQGRLISIPYTVEINDAAAYLRRLSSPQHFSDAMKAQFDQLYAEGGRVMCIALHPYLAGQPYRLAALIGALDHIAAHKDVWCIGQPHRIFSQARILQHAAQHQGVWVATGSEILAAFLAQAG